VKAVITTAWEVIPYSIRLLNGRSEDIQVERFKILYYLLAFPFPGVDCTEQHPTSWNVMTSRGRNMEEYYRALSQLKSTRKDHLPCSYFYSSKKCDRFLTFKIIRRQLLWGILHQKRTHLQEFQRAIRKILRFW
jgi:hypothetical protein